MSSSFSSSPFFISWKNKNIRRQKEKKQKNTHIIFAFPKIPHKMPKMSIEKGSSCYICTLIYTHIYSKYIWDCVFIWYTNVTVCPISFTAFVQLWQQFLKNLEHIFVKMTYTSVTIIQLQTKDYFNLEVWTYNEIEGLFEICKTELHFYHNRIVGLLFTILIAKMLNSHRSRYV